MCALAELMRNSGVLISGSDVPDVFYTDAILRELNIPVHENFSPENIDGKPDLLIYSAAYSPNVNPELIEAGRKGIPTLKYPDALGAYSALFDASGIAGVHGKTTTTAIAGALIRAAGLPAQILAGSAVSSFGGRSTLNLGNRYFVAETCEYRRHFLAFHPNRIVLTSVEWDHQDFFPSYEAIADAFLDYIRKLPPGGELIYCADDPGARETAKIIDRENRGVRLCPYGFSADGPFGIERCEVKEERLVAGLQGFAGEFRLRLSGQHNARNAAAALALTDSLLRKEFGEEAERWNEKRLEAVREALEDFRGSKRRSEILGEAGGILFMDDYGHHPTAIRTTLNGLREFYRDRRLVVSFMSHTYTRTAALLEDFASSFDCADILFLHRIYPSAREAYHGGVTGEVLFEKTKRMKDTVYYTEEPEDAAPLLKKILAPGDLFITLGAGDNWKLGKALLEYYRKE
jgi:UDP-N-acetylmuramate--alanine ligase